MANQQPKNPIRIELTEEQRQKIREATGRDDVAVESTGKQLKDRNAPGIAASGAAGATDVTVATGTGAKGAEAASANAPIAGTNKAGYDLKANKSL